MTEEFRPLDVYGVRARVEQIRTVADEDHDNEKAHSLEDALYRDVLETIARGPIGKPNRALAREALEAGKIEFERWAG